MNDCILEMKSITKEYPGVKALDNVNLQVRRGEIHALVGENGAGKSTTKEKQLWAISTGLKLTALLEKK